ncbi:hypothetical protein ACJJTC_006260 [Scirpophaga incertulas]
MYAGDKAAEISRRAGEVADAWAALQAACRARRAKLQDADRLYRFLSQLRALQLWMDDVVRQMNTGEKPRDVSGVELLMNNHQSLKAEIDAREDSFAACIALGKELLAAQHYAAADIRDKLLHLSDLRNALLRRWEERWENLQLILEVYQFARDAAVAEAWLVAQEPYLMSQELGHTIDEVESLIKKHEAFEKSAAAQEDRFSALQRLTTFEVKEMKRRQEAAEAAERERREREAAEAAAARDAVDRAAEPDPPPLASPLEMSVYGNKLKPNRHHSPTERRACDKFCPVTYRCVVHTCTRVVVRRTSTKAAEKAQERPHSQPEASPRPASPSDAQPALLPATASAPASASASKPTPPKPARLSSEYAPLVKSRSRSKSPFRSFRWRTAKKLIAGSHHSDDEEGASPAGEDEGVEGTLVRKHEWESAAKRASNRSWDKVYVVAKEGRMAFYKDQKSYKATPEQHWRGEAPLDLNRAVVEVAANYTKKKHVFRLRLDNGAEFLLQAHDEAEMQWWLDGLRARAAAPPARSHTLPAPAAEPKRRSFFTLKKKSVQPLLYLFSP